MAENRRRAAAPDKDVLAALSSTPTPRLQKATTRDVVSDLAGPQRTGTPAPQSAAETTTEMPRATPRTGPAKKTSFYQGEDDANRMRAAYLNTQLQTGYSSLSEFINAAIDEKISTLETTYNNGNPWKPLTTGTIPTGKPLKR